MSETLMNMSNPYISERRAGFSGPAIAWSVCETARHNGQLCKRWRHGRGLSPRINVFQGYWRREEVTRSVFVDGYFRTGDLAIRSADGYYTLCGRKSDLIIWRFNIYPREIEEYLEERDCRSRSRGCERSDSRGSAGCVCRGA